MMKRALLALGHLLVDAACAYLCLRYVAAFAELHTHLLLYNFFAFAVQMPVGLLADRLHKNSAFAALGAGLVAIAFLFVRMPVPAVIVAGLGNAFYHVGGGVESILTANGRCAPLGFFVAPGAVGIYLGTLAAKSVALPLWLLPSLLLMLAFAVQTAAKDAPVSASVPRKPSGAAVRVLVFLFLVVLLRSFAGMHLSFSWKTGVAAALFALGAAAGKALGGVLGDRCGLLRTAVLSLLTAALLFVFSENTAFCGIAAVLLFNMTMPITLRAAADALRGLEGFSFGLLTFALFVGLLPSYCGFAIGGSTVVAVAAAVSSLSAVLLIPGLRRLRDA